MTRPACLLLPAALLAACSDYELGGMAKPAVDGDDTGGLEPEPEPEPEPDPQPAAELSAAELDLGIICGFGASDVELRSVGEAPLTVSAVEVPAGWYANHAPLPATLEPGEALVVTVSGSGAGSVIFRTDDPVSPEIELPVTAALDGPPTVQITAPVDLSVLDVGATTPVTATVTDDRDDPAEVVLSWASDVDGAVFTGNPDSAGLATFAWNGTAATPGDHRLTVTATDTCGNTATDTIGFCQNAGYDSETLDLTTWNFEGTARYDAGNAWVELTAPTGNAVGTAFQTASTASSDNIQIEFSFYVSGGSGADGISLTALDQSRMSGFLGGAGGGIGYYGLPGWSIEVDTWYNGEHNDPTPDDHVSVHIDGNVNSYQAWAALPEMEDGAWHTMAVSVTGTWMTVDIDGVRYIDQSVPALAAFPAYVGFTAATGGATNYHLIDALVVEEFVCEG